MNLSWKNFAVFMGSQNGNIYLKQLHTIETLWENIYIAPMCHKV